LFEIFSLELPSEVFDGFFVVFGAIEAVSDLEAHIMIFFYGIDTSLQTFDKFGFFSEKEIKCFFVLASVVISQCDVVIIIGLIFRVPFGEGPIDSEAHIGRISLRVHVHGILGLIFTGMMH
jgi:hypothetical protein